MIKTSLTRGLVAMVAITFPMAGSSVRVNAQAVQTTEVLTVDKNQLDKQNPDKIDKNEGRGNPPMVAHNDNLPVVAPGIIEKESLQDYPIVKVLTTNSATVSNAAVIVPNGTKLPITGQVPQPKPTQPAGTESNQENQNLPTTPPTSSPNPETTEARVLVSEVVVKTETGKITPELEAEIYKVIRTQAGQTATRSQLQEDINGIVGIGLFSNVQAVPEDTPLGVRVSFIVTPNPILSQVELEANPGTGVASVLPAETVKEIFSSQYGKILNLRELQEGIKQLTKRYQDQGYVLANLIGVPKISENGVVTLQIAEGVVENVKVKFRDKEGQEVNEKGEAIRGRTKDYIITREVELKPGQVFNRNIVQRDLQRVFGLGLFEDVNISLDPGTDASKVNVVINVAERSSGSIAAVAGISSASGLFGTISYQQQNLGGRNQKLGDRATVRRTGTTI